jgi:hypothetical protein
MKKDKQWQQPDLSVMKQRDTKKVIGSSRKENVRYRTGPTPTPLPPPPYSRPEDEDFS